MSASTSHGFAAIALMMFVVGTGIPLMATLNAGLGQHIGSIAASAILCGVAFVLAGALLLATGLPARSAFTGVAPYYYGAAVVFVLYAVTVTWSAPRIGVGNAVFFVLLGQLVAAAAIDHFGLFGAIRSAITLRRAAGVAVMALGVYLARKPQ